MQRAWFFAGWGYVAISSAIVLKATFGYPPLSMPPIASPPRIINTPPAQPVGSDNSGPLGWFTAVRPHCNSLEVELTLQQNPPPAGWEGTGYAASCWAVAGQIERARALVLELPESDRYSAASIIFNIGHPIADAGDDRSAGPIMQLVVEFQSNNYMALYHAGMSYYAVGQPRLAKKHLEAFLQQYDVQDGWRSNATEILDRLRKDGV
jgi:hypothetical protein